MALTSPAAGGTSAPERSRPSIVAAGVVVFRPGRQILLVHRPKYDDWSFPKGKLDPGETLPAAAVREVAEETGLAVAVQRYAGRVERDAPDGGIYVIDDYVCSVVGGRLRAGDDAEDAAWFGRADLPGLDLVPGLVEALTEWDALPD